MRCRDPPVPSAGRVAGGQGDAVNGCMGCGYSCALAQKPSMPSKTRPAAPRPSAARQRAKKTEPSSPAADAAAVVEPPPAAATVADPVAPAAAQPAEAPRSRSRRRPGAKAAAQPEAASAAQPGVAPSPVPAVPAEPPAPDEAAQAPKGRSPKAAVARRRGAGPKATGSAPAPAVVAGAPSDPSPSAKRARRPTTGAAAAVSGAADDAAPSPPSPVADGPSAEPGPAPTAVAAGQVPPIVDAAPEPAALDDEGPVDRAATSAADGPPVEAEPTTRSRRARSRSRSRSRPHPSDGADASASPAEDAADEGPRARRPAPPATPAASDAPAPTPAAPAAAPPPAAPPARIEPIAEPGGFVRYTVHCVGDEPAEVELYEGAVPVAACGCLDFTLADDARCAHADALLARRREGALPVPAAPRRSRLGVVRAARCTLAWQSGRNTPAAVEEIAARLLPLPDGAEGWLARLLRAARDAGHEVEVAEPVWRQLAHARDAANRVRRLEALMPAGPEDEVIGALGAGALLPVQAEAALFAVCAGRCVIADAAALEPAREAFAAARLWQRHFGVRRILLLAPRDGLDRWRQRLGEDADGWSLMAVESVAADAALHRSIEPELVIVDEPAEGGLWVDPAAAEALLRLPGEHAIVLPAPAWLERGAEMPLRVAFVDAARQGAYAALVARHGVRDADGALCGVTALETVRETLEPVCLARTLDEVRARLPERIEQVVRVPLGEADRQWLRGRARELAAEARQAAELGWMSDAAQRTLLARLQSLRRAAAGDAAGGGPGGVAPAKAAALLGRLHAAGAGSRWVVFGQWPGALQAVGERLSQAGVPCYACRPGDEPAERRDVVARFDADSGPALLLVPDAAGAGLDWPGAPVTVVHLDRPWSERQLLRRFGRLYRRGQAVLVPVLQLLAEGSIEDALQARPADRADAGAELLDAQPAEGFVPPDQLRGWLEALASLLEGD